jgi:hypothetical protein
MGARTSLSRLGLFVAGEDSFWSLCRKKGCASPRRVILFSWVEAPLEAFEKRRGASGGRAVLIRGLAWAAFLWIICSRRGASWRCRAAFLITETAERLTVCARCSTKPSSVGCFFIVKTSRVRVRSMQVSVATCRAPCRPFVPGGPRMRRGASGTAT